MTQKWSKDFKNTIKKREFHFFTAKEPFYWVKWKTQQIGHVFDSPSHPHPGSRDWLISVLFSLSHEVWHIGRPWQCSISHADCTVLRELHAKVEIVHCHFLSADKIQWCLCEWRLRAKCYETQVLSKFLAKGKNTKMCISRSVKFKGDCADEAGKASFRNSRTWSLTAVLLFSGGRQRP